MADTKKDTGDAKPKKEHKTFTKYKYDNKKRIGVKKKKRRGTGRPKHCPYPNNYVFKKTGKRKEPPKKMVLKRPSFIPESALKSRRWMKANRAWHNKLHQQWYDKLKNWRVQYYRRAEHYHLKYLSKERHEINMKRIAKRKWNFYIPPEGKLLIVVRIRGINRMHPMTKKILQLLRLRQVNNAVFVRVNKATLNMLRKIEPYVTYGTPTRKTVSDLIYKRGYVKFNQQRVPIQDNFVISKRLLRYGIICVEDLIHEILTVGDNFKRTNNYLWPFKLRAPVGGYKGKGKHFTEGGSAGNRHEEINKLIRRMM